ncbi:MAG: plasmid mobilization protein [Candidatus Binatia bacterium]
MASQAIKRRKPQVERKEELIPVRCTKAQKKILAERARARGVPVSTWLLQLGLSAPDDPTKG